MTLVEFAEREVARMRADLARRDPESISIRYVDSVFAACPPDLYDLVQIRATLLAWEQRPSCPLTPAVLTLAGAIADVRIDCGWHIKARSYLIQVRRIVDDQEHGIDRLLPGRTVTGAIASAIWAHETLAVIEDVRRLAGLGSLTPDMRAQIRRHIAEQASAQGATTP